jgi:hypothetical protein
MDHVRHVPQRLALVVRSFSSPRQRALSDPSVCLRNNSGKRMFENLKKKD